MQDFERLEVGPFMWSIFRFSGTGESLLTRRIGSILFVCNFMSFGETSS